jgi:hypothetical protein
VKKIWSRSEISRLMKLLFFWDTHCSNGNVLSVIGTNCGLVSVMGPNNDSKHWVSIFYNFPFLEK